MKSGPANSEDEGSHLLDEIEGHLEDEPRSHPWLWVLALFFLLLGVPFYYPASREPVLLYGLPDWCWVTLFADIAFAITVSVMTIRYWKQKKDPGESS